MLGGSQKFAGKFWAYFKWEFYHCSLPPGRRDCGRSFPKKCSSTLTMRPLRVFVDWQLAFKAREGYGLHTHCRETSVASDLHKQNVPDIPGLACESFVQ